MKPAKQKPKRNQFSKKLLVPVPVSVGFGGRAKKKTWGFVELGTKAPKKKIMGDLLAQRSHYFMKRFTKSEAFIREKVRKAGLPVEESIQNLGGGLQLFAKKNWHSLLDVFDLSAWRGSKGKPNWVYIPWVENPKVVSKRIMDYLTKLHSIGIAHNEPVLRNFVSDSRERVMIIDFSRSKYYSKKPVNKKEFLERFGVDIYFGAQTAHAILLQFESPLEAASVPVSEIVRAMLSEHQNFMNTFGLHPKK